MNIRYTYRRSYISEYANCANQECTGQAVTAAHDNAG